jgi:antirestriction protein ArdC
VINALVLRSEITLGIIDSLTNGKTPPWRKTWSDDPNAPGLHSSLHSRHGYRGINQLLLQVAMEQRGYRSKWWGTFPQIKALGSSVRKGESGTRIILWKPFSKKKTDTAGKEVEEHFFVMRQFTVFNVEQTSGLHEFRIGHAPPSNPILRYEHADAVIEATGVTIQYGGNKAQYSTGGDYIICPARHQFECLESFYETLFHELIHWTEKRIGIDRSSKKNSYAFCELVAELGGCFLMGELGLPMAEVLPNSVSYLSNWLQGMQGDASFVIKAASQASKAVDFILSFSQVPVLTDDEVPF